MSIVKKAAEYAEQRCAQIQKRRDVGLSPYSIKEAIIVDYLAGAKEERERIERELRAYDKGWKTPHQQFVDLEVVIKIVRGEA